MKQVTARARKSKSSKGGKGRKTHHVTITPTDNGGFTVEHQAMGDNPQEPWKMPPAVTSAHEDAAGMHQAVQSIFPNDQSAEGQGGSAPPAPDEEAA